ncbi:hypothetical protein J4Q44_G00281720 [Coregonus suidteri]|uniref:Uncharacterized protein n=1 Tax=Coregonus suidteri TaxID=861788 RepID=A0AAN8QE95_9TELE
MMFGEILAYPLFLQKELSGSRNIPFMCTDVICKFWPYLTKVALHCPELATLLDMKPLLSVMHAKSHRLKCEIKWGGPNQEGAGITLGEEVEQGNSFLLRAAICSKQMSKGDGCKRQHPMRRKILEEKVKLTAAIGVQHPCTRFSNTICR